VVEQSQEQFGNAAIGTVADQDQSQDELFEPGLGDRDGEQNVIVALGRFRFECLLQSNTSGVYLLGDELATNIILLGGIGDRASAGKDIESDLLAVSRAE